MSNPTSPNALSNEQQHGAAESLTDGPRQSLTCPTCKAVQVPSSGCRRCGSDLELLVTMLDENLQLRRQSLTLLRQRRLMRATRIARQCWALSSNDDNARLLATCYLLQGDFSAAVQVLK